MRLRLSDGSAQKGHARKAVSDSIFIRAHWSFGFRSRRLDLGPYHAGVIVRCGRCQIELEVAGPGEFLCPSCGTRNAVRGAPGMPPPSPFDIGGGPGPGVLATPGYVPPSSLPKEEEAPLGITWSACPTCAWKFAHGESGKITCPNCSVNLVRTDDGLTADPE